LYLKVVVDELRMVGVFEKLADQLQYYLQAKTIPQLYELVLSRWEKDYNLVEEQQNNLAKKNKIRPEDTAVGQFMCLLYAAHHGLSEYEILEIMRLPHEFWTQLYAGVESGLVNRSGLLTFSHEHLQKAVFKRYLSNPKKSQLTQARLILASYFEKSQLSVRKVEELPWLYFKMNDFDKLCKCITTDLDLFLQLYTEEKKYDLIRYCTAITEEHKRRIVQKENELKLIEERKQPITIHVYNYTMGTVETSVIKNTPEEVHNKNVDNGIPTITKNQITDKATSRIHNTKLVTNKVKRHGNSV